MSGVGQAVFMNQRSFGLSEDTYTIAGTYTFIAPSGLSPASVSVICIGGGGGTTAGTFSVPANGGGGGGELRFKNNFSVTGGNSYTVVVGAGGDFGLTDGSRTSLAGGQSTFNSTTCVAKGGSRGQNNTTGAAGGSGGTGDGGGNGGDGGFGDACQGRPGGGGGAGGYTGDGGAGGKGDTTNVLSGGTNGSGGGGGGGRGGNSSNLAGTDGGGTCIGGAGSNGAGAAAASGFVSGGNGSVISPDFTVGFGKGAGVFGTFGGAAPFYGIGGVGAVRIIYSFAGVTRAFPSTNTGKL